MQHPIADKFKTGELVKPIAKKEEFYVGGVYAMKERLKVALRPFPGAFIEYIQRTEGICNSSSIATMRDYIRIE